MSLAGLELFKKLSFSCYLNIGGPKGLGTEEATQGLL
jgi:hypothetical protein